MNFEKNERFPISHVNTKTKNILSKSSCLNKLIDYYII